MTLTVTASAGFGVDMTTAQFDHAALVAAHRSRADGYDFAMYHTTYGYVRMIGTHDLNTSAAVVEFVAPVTSTNDSGYRLVFGDLGQTTSRVSAVVVGTLGDVTAITIPAVALPAPAHALTSVLVQDRADLAYPDALAPRRRDWNENTRYRYVAEWRGIPPEDWYEIRAWVRAHAGGATGSAVSWCDSRVMRLVPGSFSMSQESAAHYSASLTLEELVA